MSWLSDLASDLTVTHEPLSYRTLFGVFLPPLLCYFAAARLVLSKGRFPLRICLLALTIWTAYRASVHVGLTGDHDNRERLVYRHHTLLVLPITLVMRVYTWTFQRHPYRRIKPSGSKFADASDLCFNLRGVGWTWSKGLKLPAETRNVRSTFSFLFATLLHMLYDIFMFDLVLYSLQSCDPHTIGTPAGGSIFDIMALPFAPRLLRAGVICGLSGAIIYFTIEIIYLLSTFPAILIFRQSPEVWPPLFANPWLSTSLNEFWSYRWHQIFRDIFIFCGSPIGSLTGSRSCAMLGSFFSSALLHHIAQGGGVRGSDFVTVGGFFIMMGVGTILERSWKKITGNHVCGFIGWLWTSAWVAGWSLLLVQGVVMRAIAANDFSVPDGWRPGVFVTEKLKIVLIYLYNQTFVLTRSSKYN